MKFITLAWIKAVSQPIFNEGIAGRTIWKWNMWLCLICISLPSGTYVRLTLVLALFVLADINMAFKQ